METTCSNCKSQNVIFSKKRQVYECEDCGHEFKEEKQFTPLRIFISYGRDEYVALAERLKDDLQKRGHEVWFDKEKLKTGGDWEQYIEKGLEFVSKDISIGRLVFIITPHSTRRPDGYCLNEIARAITRAIPIIPVMLVYAEPPLSICRIQYLDMQDSYPPDEKTTTYEQRLQRLIAALQENKIDFEGFQSKLLSTLQPIKFQADIYKLTRNFTGRQWAIDAIDKWFIDPEGTKVFWIVGMPGSGKSALSAWIQENRRQIVAHHFCDINSEEKRDARKLVKSIAYQLSTQLPAYEERLKGIPIETIVNEYQEAYTLFDKLLVQPLSENFPEPDRTLVILIDAIDEATYQGINEIAKFLSLCADKTPKWLRFLITSRPEQEVTTQLQALSPYTIDTTNEENKEDLRQYLKEQLPQINTKQIEEIINIGEGLFLYIKHVCDEIKAGRLSLDRIDKFPQGLGGIYKQFFDIKFEKSIDYYKKEISPLLCLIFASFEPLTLGHLKELLNKANLMELFDITDTLGSLFPCSGGKKSDTIKPFHRSIRDWITDKEKSGKYCIDINYGHEILAEDGFRQYKQNVKPMNDYYLEWLPMHLIIAQRYQDAVEILKDFNYMMERLKAGDLERLLSDYKNAVTQLPKDEQDNLKFEVAFFRERAHILRRGSDEWQSYKILLQLAVEHADDSPLTIGAEQYLKDGKVDWLWLRRNQRDKHTEIDPCIAVLEGHTDMVYGAIELTDDRILSWSWDDTLRIWDREGKAIAVLEGHTDMVYGAIELTDGRILSWSYDDTLRIWDREGKAVAVLKGHTGWVYGAIELRDGRILSWSDDKTLRIWDREGKAVAVIKGHTGWVYGAIELRDGRILSWSSDRTLRIWDREGKAVAVIKGHTGWVYGAIELRDGRILSWSDDNTLRIWDREGKAVAVLEGHTDMVYGAIELTDGRILSWSDDKTLRIWDREGKAIAVLEGNKYNVKGVIKLSDGRILTWSFDSTLRIWDRDRIAHQVLKYQNDMIKEIIVLENGRILMWSSDRTLRIWDKDGKAITVLDGHTKSVNGAIELKDSRILSWAKDNTLRLWDRDGKAIAVLRGHTDWVNGAIELSDDRILSWSSDCTLRIWDKDGKAIAVLEGHIDSVQEAIELKDGSILSWSGDRNISLRDTQTIFIIWNKDGTFISKFYGNDGFRTRAIELRDNMILLWGNFENTFLMWNRDGKKVKVFHGHTNFVNGAFELSDGKILSWSRDNTLRKWDRDGNELECHPLSEGLALYPEASVSMFGKKVLSDDSWLTSHGYSARLCNTRLNPKETIFWHGTSQCTPRLLRADGTAVVTQANGQVCFLNLYRGNKRITLDEVCAR